MIERISEGRLQVAAVLHRLVSEHIARGTGVAPQAFWLALEKIVEELGPGLRMLLGKRDLLQGKLDDWCRSMAGEVPQPAATRKFLIEIGYFFTEAEHSEIYTLTLHAALPDASPAQTI